MFASLKGRLVNKTTSFVEIDVGGLGFAVFVSLNTLTKIGEVGDEVLIHTVVFSRDDTFQIFGFATKEEKEIFQELIKISGIGPKIALAILSYLDLDEFINCVLDNEITKLTKLPGIGKKTAERILLEFREKVKKFDRTENYDLPIEKRNLFREAISALSVLGYQENKVKNVVTDIIKSNKDKELTIEELLKLSLRALNK